LASLSGTSERGASLHAEPLFVFSGSDCLCDIGRSGWDTGVWAFEMEELAERGWSKEYEAWRNGSGLAVRKRKERRSAWAGVASVLLLLGMWCAPGYAAEAQ